MIKQILMDKQFIAEAEFDFHQFERLTPYDIEKYLSEFLEDSYAKGYTFILVITGKGKVVKPLVQKFLAENKLVKHFQLAGYFNGQGGAFEVTLTS
jgi:DNA-nicking Smr family endonuclease